MAKKVSFGFNEQFFIDKGYVSDGKGGWSPPPIKSNFIRGLKAKNILQEAEIIAKEKVNNSPDFKVIPTMEWFISGYNVPSKKNSRQNFVSKTTHKMISLPSKKHAEYIKMTAMQYEVFGREFRKAVDYYDLQYPLRIEFMFIRSSKHQFDYCNACQTCEDIMKGKWIPDDSADFIIPSFKPYSYDKNNPGVKIKLLLK